MADEIKQKITLEGEKEYSAALKEANRNLKTLRSELKAETAELGNNASAQQKNEAKARSLRKQIEQQERIVETLKSALKEAKERYGDNAEETAKWEQKLNAARYTLATMNNQLDAATEAIKDQQDALKDSAGSYDDAANAAGDYADAVGASEQTANAVTFSGVIQAADNLTEKLKSAINFIIEVGKTAWEWMGESGTWADDLTTNAAKFGLDRQTLQGWQYAELFVDATVEDIVKAYTKLGDQSDSTKKKLKELFNIKVKGNVPAQEIFWKVIDSLHDMENEAARNAKGQQLFGDKVYQNLIPLVEAGRESWDGFVKEANDKGLILSEEQIDNLGKFDDASQQLQTSFAAMQHSVAAELAPAFTEVAKGMSSLIQSFTEWSKTESGQKTLQDLGEAIKGIADQLVGERNFDSIVRGAADGVRKLTEALGWISDHWTTVETGIKGIGIAFGGLTIGSDVLKALMLIKGIKWLGGGGAAAGAASGAAEGAATAAGGTAGASLFARIFGSTAAKVAGGATAFLTTFFGDFFRPKNSLLGSMEDPENVSAVIADGVAAVLDKETAEERHDRAVRNGRGTDWGGTGETVYKNHHDALGQLPGRDQGPFQLTPEQIAAAQGYWDAYRNGEDGGDTLDALLNAIPDEGVLNSLMDKIEEFAGANSSMEDLPDAWFSDVLDALTWENAGDSETTDAVNGLQILPREIGDAAYAGVVNGISGLQITLDGYSVGTLVAPYVSAQIARDMP